MRFAGRFVTLDEIEGLDFAELTKDEILYLKEHLLTAFYHTRSSELDSKGGCLKDRFGAQHSRLIDFLMCGGPSKPVQS
jgi:hypothetical protein